MQICHFISRPPPPDMKMTRSYTEHNVVCINKYCWAFYKVATPYIPEPIVQKQPD